MALAKWSLQWWNTNLKPSVVLMSILAFDQYCYCVLYRHVDKIFAFCFELSSANSKQG
jgi:hypothetical protein